MGQGTKNALIGLALFSIKVLTTLRTALDTYAVSGDLLNVALIDGAFLALWLVVAYGGSGKQALAIRPYAWGGAIALYALMIAIGVEAHRGIMAVAVRVAGGSALLYDGIDYVITLASRMRMQRGADVYARMRRRAWLKAYRRSVRRNLRDKLRGQSDALAETDFKADLAQRYAMHTHASHMHAPPALAPASTEEMHAQAALPGNTYAMLPGGRIKCNVCGWVSSKAYASDANARLAYTAHLRGRMHRAVAAL